jgi:hypothetical protein
VQFVVLCDCIIDLEGLDVGAESTITRGHVKNGTLLNFLCGFVLFDQSDDLVLVPNIRTIIQRYLFLRGLKILTLKSFHKGLPNIIGHFMKRLIGEYLLSYGLVSVDLSCDSHLLQLSCVLAAG